jgi:hypothetical protein
MKILKIESNIFNTLEKDIENTLQIKELQLYFPILSLYFKYYNNESYKQFTLKSKKFVSKINEKLQNKYEDSYIKNMFSCNIFDTRSNKDLGEREVFIKILPILDVLSFMKNDYKTDNSSLPNIYNFLTSKKINSYHNSAYIDNYFTFLGSKMVDLNLCPTFPEYLGSFTGIAQSFDFDITEEYHELVNISWFKSGLENKFTLKKVKNKKLDKYFTDIDNLEFVENDDLSCDENDEKDKNIELDKLEELLNESEVSDENSDSDGNENSYSDNDSLSIQSFNSDMSMDNSLRYLYYITLKNYPVQLVCLEKLNCTLDNLMEDGYDITDKEWKSILFQICFGLSVAQKNYEFVHNDLHSSNIMFKNTEEEFIYFRYKSKYFRIPTFGKITKIIDFGRATFKVKNQIFFSDVFKKNGDAEGQYSFPYNNTLKDCKIKPNRSFDLSRLATTIIEHFSEESTIYKLLKLWCTDKNGNDLMDYNDDFNLYKLIAKNVISAVPVKQLDKIIFKEFLIEKKDIPEGKRVYFY